MKKNIRKRIPVFIQKGGILNIMKSRNWKKNKFFLLNF